MAGFLHQATSLKWTCFYAVALSLLFCEESVLGLSIAPQENEVVHHEEAAPNSITNEFELGKVFTPQGPRKLSVAGKCFLTLAFVHFFINALWYLIKEKKNQMPAGANAKIPGMAKFDEIFTEQSLENACSSLTFVAPLAVMMLFVLFRSIDQGREVSPNSQQYYYIVVVGIIIQAADVLIHVNISGIGNISGFIGMIFTYIGYGGITYALFYDRDLSIPLSGAALTISYLSGLLFFLQLVVKNLEYKQHLPSMGSMPGPSFDKDELDSALVICENIPIMCSICMYIHFRCRFTGNLVPEGAIYSMLGTCVGIYLQAIGFVFIRGFHEAAGTMVGMAGMVINYASFGALIFFGFTVATVQSVLVECYLELMAVVVFLLIGMKILEYYARDNEALQAQLEKCLATTKYAAVLGVLLLYVHFRSRVTGDIIPDYAANGARLAVYSMFLQIAFIAGETYLTTADGPPSWVAYIRAIAIALLYIGFAMVIQAAYVVGVPKEDQGGLIPAIPGIPMPDASPMPQALAVAFGGDQDAQWKNAPAPHTEVKNAPAPANAEVKNDKPANAEVKNDKPDEHNQQANTAQAQAGSGEHGEQANAQVNYNEGEHAAAPVKKEEQHKPQVDHKSDPYDETSMKVTKKTQDPHAELGAAASTASLQAK